MRSSYLITLALSAVAYAAPVAIQYNTVGGPNRDVETVPTEYLGSAGKSVNKRGPSPLDEIEVEKGPVEIEAETNPLEVEVEIEGVAEVEVETNLSYVGAEINIEEDEVEFEGQTN